MKITTKISIVIGLMCVCATAAFSQDCESYLRRATELVAQKKYCEAKEYYLRYSKCNADADVSTEIAMCERFCKIQAMEGEENEPKPVENNPISKGQDVITLKNGEDIQAIVTDIGENNIMYKKADNPNGPVYSLKKSEVFMIAYANGSKDVFTTGGTNTSTKTNTNTKTNAAPTTKIQTQSTNTSPRFKLGINGGVQLPMGDLRDPDRTYLYFGGGISAEFLIIQRIGVGISAGYYGYEVESGSIKTLCSFMPITLTGKFYVLTKGFQPYVGFDAGLYVMGAKITIEGYGSESNSKSYFGVAPVAGFQCKLSNALALDINARYPFVFVKNEIITKTINLLGGNIGLVFSF